MKVLIISWYFPPVNTIGAVRVGKFARFMHHRGHELAVVAGSGWGVPETMPLDFPLDRLAYARFRDVNAPLNTVARVMKKALRRNETGAAPSAASAGAAATGRGRPSLLRRLADLPTLVTNVPDRNIGWYVDAKRQALRLCRDWRPDIIFASGPPYTVLMVAHTVAARLRVPWVADIRDIWADNPYDEFDQMPAWLQQLNRWLERRTLRTAAGLATVTPPMTRHYKALFPMPIETIYNGYDPQDFVGLSEEVVTPDRYLTLGYAGSIYTGRRDPTPLFQALKLMGAEAENIRVVFCGTEPTHVRALAGQCGVEHLIELRPSIPYKESLRFQRNCDALLLLMWNDVREEGVAPGKLFEYVASLRPILMIGYEKSVAANIIGERSAGLCSNDPSEIAARLRTWLAQKQGSGRLPSLPVSAREGLSRDIQYERLEHFLVKSAGG